MSLGAFAEGDAPIAAQDTVAKTTGKPPRHRQTVAKVDAVAAPEPR